MCVTFSLIWNVTLAFEHLSRPSEKFQEILSILFKFFYAVRINIDTIAELINRLAGWLVQKVE